MPNPNNLSDIIDVQVNLIDGTASSAGFSNPRFVALFAATASFPDRFKKYTGSSQQIDEALANDGFAVADGPRRMALAATTQKGGPTTIVIGRQDPGDASFTAALDAIQAEISAANEDAYAIHPDPLTTSDADHLEGFNWILNKFGLYFAQTSSAAVLNNTPGNLAEQGLALDSDRIAVLYHDAATASKLGPAQLVSGPGTYNVPNGATLDLRIDGGVLQPFVFLSGPATVTGTNTETFVFTDSDSFAFKIDNGPLQEVDFDTEAAIAVSGVTETYNLVDGDTLNVRVNGGSTVIATFNGTAGAVPTVGGAPFALVDLETVTFAIDGGGNQVVTFNTADFVLIGAATAAEINAVYTAQLTGVVVTDDGSDVTVTSARIGASTDVEIVAGTGGALVALGYGVGNNLGTGGTTAIPFLDSTTAAEAAAEINADLVAEPLTASDSGGALAIASDTVGKNSRIQVTGGTSNGEFQFSTNEVVGTGDFNDASAASAAEVVKKLNDGSFGATFTVSAGAVVITTNTRGSASKIDIVGGTNAPATLGFPIAATLGPAGPFENAAAARADEVAVFIDLTLVGGSASTVSNRVVVSSASSGSSSVVEAISGSAKSIFGFGDSALGVGTDEDHLMARWIGFSITYNLDAERGKALWDNVTVQGGFPDVIDPQTRAVLHNTLFVNTYENRNNREEFHRGSLLNNTQRYIDERTSADWGDARLTEAIKILLNNAADNKTAVPITNPGIRQVATQILGVLQRGDRNGHWIFDDTEIDPTKANDTGVTIPDVRDLTNEDIAARTLTGFIIVQRLQGGAQGAKVRFDLTRVLAEA